MGRGWAQRARRPASPPPSPGAYVNPGSVPRPLRWVPRASLIKHAFEGLAVNEFRGLTFDPTPAAAGARGGGGRDGAPGDLPDGAAVLARLGYAESTVGGTAVAQARVLAFNAWTALALLRAREPRYALADGTVEESGEEEEDA